MHQMIALHPIKGLEKKTFSNNKDSESTQWLPLAGWENVIGFTCGDPKGTGFLPDGG